MRFGDHEHYHELPNGDEYRCDIPDCMRRELEEEDGLGFADPGIEVGGTYNKPAPASQTNTENADASSAESSSSEKGT